MQREQETMTNRQLKRATPFRFDMNLSVQERLDILFQASSADRTKTNKQTKNGFRIRSSKTGKSSRVAGPFDITSMFLFGKRPSPEELVKKWRRELTKEQRLLDRQIRAIDLAEQKTIRSIKDLAKKGDKSSAKILAKEIVRSRAAKEKIYKSKAQLNSVGMQLQQNLSMMKLAGVMSKSATIMTSMNDLIKLPQLHQTMMVMGREMEKAGLIEEMMTDALEMDEDLDEAADEELDKVVQDILLGVKSAAPAVPKEAMTQEGEEDDVEDNELEARLNALKQ
ncbi:SNF7 family protein [Planoprotostelium fungivorum]|uniref:SNF7 family protein n=1 Tax=Planoprotostelium fungivorum TaxID=1890364 RepID=A0A2P6MM76_9EUKA|nr:SNF7 family protein [Planoprotostelium fungivorum]